MPDMTPKTEIERIAAGLTKGERAGIMVPNVPSEAVPYVKINGAVRRRLFSKDLMEHANTLALMCRLTPIGQQVRAYLIANREDAA